MELKLILEAMLFHAQKPMKAEELRDLLATTARESEDPLIKAYKKIPVEEIQTTIEQLEKEVRELDRSFQLACIAGAWQFVSQPEYAPWLRTMLGEKARPPRLSQPSLETLAIIAYRQPITRAEIEQIRGVNVDGVMQTLLERHLIEAMGRAETVGRPMTYGTTASFLEHFGLGSLEELPAADELRRMEIKRPEQLLTTEPGLATVPDPQLMFNIGESASAETAAGASPPEPSASPAEAAGVAEVAKVSEGDDLESPGAPLPDEENK